MTNLSAQIATWLFGLGTEAAPPAPAAARKLFCVLPYCKYCSNFYIRHRQRFSFFNDIDNVPVSGKSKEASYSYWLISF